MLIGWIAVVIVLFHHYLLCSFVICSECGHYIMAKNKNKQQKKNVKKQRNEKPSKFNQQARKVGETLAGYAADFIPGMGPFRPIAR